MNWDALRWYAYAREDRYFAPLLIDIPEPERWAVEIGAGDGYHLSNVRAFEQLGWRLYQADQGDYFTAENAAEKVRRAGVPAEFGLLSIDIDGMDWWIWNALREFRPRVVVIEYNSSFALGELLTLRYDPGHQWIGGSGEYGASYGAMVELGRRRGYRPVAEFGYANVAFMREDVASLPTISPPPLPHPLFRAPDRNRFQVIPEE